MTTPPDTPKPLSNLPTEEMIEAGLAQAYPHLTGVQPGAIVRIWQAMVVAAPKSSPQESHKLAEELERRAKSIDAEGHYYTAELLLRAAAALRSSPSERDARDAKRYRFLRDDKTGDADTVISSHPSHWDAAIDVAIAASGGAKT